MTILIVTEETRCRHIGYSFQLAARVLLYAPSNRQDNTYHSLCYTSRGALAGTRNSSMMLYKLNNNFTFFTDVFQDDDPDWKRTTRAAIFDRLPSHQALASDEGITLSRTWRRRKQTQQRPAETEVDGPSCSYAAPSGSVDRKKRYDASFSSDHDSSFHTLKKRSSVKSMTARMAVRRKYM